MATPAEQSMVETNSILDSEPVYPSESYKYGVVISVPLIYINKNETIGIDQVISNLRVVNENVLLELTNKATTIANANKDQQIEITEYFINRLMQQTSNQPDVNAIMEFLQFVAKLAKDLDIDDEYYDITTQSVSFDVIRYYVADSENGILKSAEPTPFKQYHLYSQLPQTYHDYVRQATNDTPFNRIQYKLANFEKSLTFTPGFVYSHAVKVIDLALFYLCRQSCKPSRHF